MENKKVLVSYSGSDSEQRTNKVVWFGDVKDLVIDPNYFKRNFRGIDEKFFDYFDFTIKESPSVRFQRFTIENAFIEGGPPSQGKMIEIFKKTGIYQEYTLCHIAQILLFPSFDAEKNLSTWSHNDCFLLRNKYGNLCWVVIPVSSYDMHSCPDGPRQWLEIYDFQPDQKVPTLSFHMETPGLEYPDGLFRIEI